MSENRFLPVIGGVLLRIYTFSWLLLSASHSEHRANEQLDGSGLTGGGTGKKCVCGRKKHRMVEEEEDKGNQCQLHAASAKQWRDPVCEGWTDVSAAELEPFVCFYY